MTKLAHGGNIWLPEELGYVNGPSQLRLAIEFALFWGGSGSLTLFSIFLFFPKTGSPLSNLHHGVSSTPFGIPITMLIITSGFIMMLVRGFNTFQSRTSVITTILVFAFVITMSVISITQLDTHDFKSTEKFNYIGQLK
jgi:hypothetical protein